MSLRELIKEGYDTDRFHIDREVNASAIFDDPLSEEEKERMTAYHGRLVTWYGDKGRVLKLAKDEVTPMWGNIFYDEKFSAVVKYIEEAERMGEDVEFQMGYGVPTVVDLIDVIETQESFYSDSFSTDYMEDSPYSLGDEELDEIIGDYENYIYDNAPTKEEIDFYQENGMDVITGYITVEEFRNRFTEEIEEIDEDSVDFMEEFMMYYEEIQEAVEGEYGDIGSVNMQMRDGNHRTFGAIKAGEDYVYALVSTDESISDLDPKIKSRLI